MDKDNRWVVCPLCSRNRKLTTHDKGEISFSSFEPETSPCIDFRDISGGRGIGFPRIGSLTLEEMKGREEYRELLVEIRDQAKRIAAFLEDIEE